MSIVAPAVTSPHWLEELTPRQIVAELDRYVVGQKAAKKAVAIALRNRWRRQRLQAPMAEEIYPKNILMIGPTGVGKTEIARRLAKPGTREEGRGVRAPASLGQSVLVRWRRWTQPASRA